MASPMVQIQVTAPVSDAHKTVLTDEAVAFLKKLSSTFEGRRQQLPARSGTNGKRGSTGENCPTSCPKPRTFARRNGPWPPFPRT